MQERRRHPRVRVDSVAFIITKVGNPVSCRVTDRSPDGARLVVDSILGIPNQFRLMIQKTREEFAATVVWRGPREVGVAFEETISAPIVVETAEAPLSIAIPLDLGIVLPAPNGQAGMPAADTGLEA